MKTNQLLLAMLAGAMGSSAASTAEGDGAVQTRTSATIRLRVEGRMPALRDATGWLNSPVLRTQDLQGKVVLVQFGTYSCINWIRTLPYIRSWAAKYEAHGLVVIGVHTPEFGFEKDIDRVRPALETRGIKFPVAIDNDFAIWRAFKNDAWPALYFVDAKGRVRHSHVGEGEYEKSELIIQQLLAEAGNGCVDDRLVAVEARGAEVGADWGSLRSGENYLGHARTVNFASGRAARDRSHAYSAPARLRLNHWALAGDWNQTAETIISSRANGRIIYRFQARDLHLVMGSVRAGVPVRFRVSIDGHPPGAAHGTDVDEQGNGTVDEHRLYQLIRQPLPIVDRHFEIEFLDAGVEAFSFTFG